jgi:hypothetical protein
LLLQKNIIPASFHDGLLLYVQAVTETLAQGGTVTDGENITQRMWNRSFQGQGLELSGMGCFGAGGEIGAPSPRLSQQEKKPVTQLCLLSFIKILHAESACMHSCPFHHRADIHTSVYISGNRGGGMEEGVG